MENDILKHRMAVISNIEKSFREDIVEKGFEDEVNPFEYAEWENSLTKAELDEFEKAKHQDGDIHPNGKWVWRQSANGGKGDWRVANPKRGGSKATAGGASTSTPSSGSTGPLNTSSSYFSKLSNSLIEKYSKKKESVSLSDIEEFYEDYLRDRGQEPTRKAYANEAKKTYDAIVGNWNKKSSNTVTHDNNGNRTFEKIRKTALSSPGITLFEEVKTEEGNRGIKIGNKASHSIHWFDEYKGVNGQQYLLTLHKRLKRLEQKHDDNERLSKVKTSEDFWKYLQSIGEADPKRGLSGYDVKSFVKTAKDELQAERYLKDVEIPVTRYIINELNNKTNTESSDNVNKLKLNGVDITVKRDPKDKYGYIVEGNGKSVKTQDPSFYNVTKLTGLTKKTIADMLDIPLKTTAKKKTDDKNTSSASNEVSVKDVKAIETFPDLDEDKYLKRGNKVLKEYTLSVNINGKKIEGTAHEFWASNTLSNTSVGGFETTVYIGSGFPLDKHVKTLEEAKSLFLSTVKKKLESKTYSSDSADAYDKGDGKIGNYPKPTVNVGKPARQLYNLLDKNRHFRFKYGMPSDEIMKKLKTYQGNVVYSYHNNAGTDEIYRIEFK